MNNLLNKEDLQLILENLISKYIYKYKDELKMFISNMKDQFAHNKQARDILLSYSKNRTLSKEESETLKQISLDILKMLSLGGIIILPGGSLLMIFIFKLAKMLKIDVIPSQFSK